jgi:DNA-directed RNA polymerase specialized sigma24 family protein
VTTADATCWTLIHAAAGGDRAARDGFARLYEPIAQIYLAARWRQSICLAALDDAVQDVFVECFKSDGVLDKVVESHPEGFRAFFHGVLRNIARRHESARGASQPLSDNLAADDTSLSRAFDKAWARSLLKEAARVQAATAADSGERAVKRVELLRLRFQEGLPIRDIAIRWNDDSAKLHHEFATARDEFRAALTKVVAFHMPAASQPQLDTACRAVLDLLK